uniref:mRNA decay activator protein ZFP36 n=1 Tax=Tanacetum cinerariifolium TaxID=118510 RepID=A0A6L2K7G2_TANCI|nr:mRNA decay activator protein ZFP36 [Tanacetum cinerariifolium]
MDGFYGISNSNVHKRSALSPITKLPSPNSYYNQKGPVVDPYASPDGHTSGSENVSSPFLRYIQSARTLFSPPLSAGDYPALAEYKYHRSSGNRSSVGSSRMELPPRQSRSPVVFSNSPVKGEDDVLVMDGVLVKNQPVVRNRSLSSSLKDFGGSSFSGGSSYSASSSLSGGLSSYSGSSSSGGSSYSASSSLSGGSSSYIGSWSSGGSSYSASSSLSGGSSSYIGSWSSGGSSSYSGSSSSGGLSSSGSKNFKTELCLSYLEKSGFCRYGTKCQFAHGNKELRQSPVTYKTVLQKTPCKYRLSGTCAFGSKCRFLHYETSPLESSSVPSISPFKLDEPTISNVNIKSNNWTPLDDGIDIKTANGTTQAEEEFEAYVNKVLYGPRRMKRLPVFNQICPE